jgi:hypothetical protein
MAGDRRCRCAHRLFSEARPADAANARMRQGMKGEDPDAVDLTSGHRFPRESCKASLWGTSGNPGSEALNG